MAHTLSPEAEAILDRKFPVLDKGFIRLVDYLGNDARIVEAARVSYGVGTKSIRQDEALIDYLLRNQHTSPFEQVILTFNIKLPIFVARQWIRHRTARMNEISGRYSILQADFYIPTKSDIAYQNRKNKQGRETEPVEIEMADEIIAQFTEEQQEAYTKYEKLIKLGIARELARINLPVSLYTEWFWQIDLHNLFHFLSLRMDAHAQSEIRAYANTLFELTKKVAPSACAAFERHILNGVTFSGTEMKELRRMLVGGKSRLEGKELERFEIKIQQKISEIK